MKMTQTCEKFNLDEDMFYYLSGIDGSLFVSEPLNEFINNDRYCFDYFQIGNETIEVMKKKMKIL